MFFAVRRWVCQYHTKAFKNPKKPFRIVIVRDMWLTGVDAPCLHTMYVDTVALEAGTHSPWIIPIDPSGMPHMKPSAGTLTAKCRALATQLALFGDK
jgi:hypothetical protein